MDEDMKALFGRNLASEVLLIALMAEVSAASPEMRAFADRVFSRARLVLAQGDWNLPPPEEQSQDQRVVAIGEETAHQHLPALRRLLENMPMT